MDFEEWLTTQANRDDLIGNLARDYIPNMNTIK